MSEVNPAIELTYAKSVNGDPYDFGARASLARREKEERGLEEFEPLPSPWTLEIEPTLICNARCHFCSYEQDIANFRQEQKESPYKTMGISKDVVMDVLDSVAATGATKGIFWSGGGDPLVWRHIRGSLDYASGHGLKNCIQTNGILLHKLMDKDGGPGSLSGVNVLSVSVYADERGLHEQIAGVDTFDRVVNNLRRVVDVRDRFNLDLSVGVKIMVDSLNYKRVSDIYDFYEALGVDVVALREVQDFNYGGEGQRSISVELTPTQREEMKANLSSNANGIVRNFVNAQLLKNNESWPTTNRCYNATDGHFACIDARGDVYLGNPEIGDKEFLIGSVQDTPWTDVWGGALHHEVIRKMDGMQRNDLCKKALCRHVKANVGVDSYLANRQDISADIARRSMSAFL